MQTIFWKELRENAKWAALAAACLFLAGLVALSKVRGYTGFEGSGLSIGSSSFLLVTFFGCALAGVLLGCMQILPELRRDQWAMLLHRPLPWSSIFYGKVLAGIILYVAATLPPLAACVGYTTLPGKFAVPFVPGMILPVLNDWLLGLVFYFAALLLCLHRGNWWGSRSLLILSGIAFGLLHLSSWGFLWLPWLGMALYFLGARSAMVGQVVRKSQPAGGRWAVLLLLGVGGQTAVLFVVSFLNWLPSGKPGISWGNSYFYITREGEVYWRSQKDMNAPATLTDREGKPVTDERYLGNDQYSHSISANAIAWELSPKPVPAPSVFYRSPWCHLQPVRNYYRDKEAWYLLVKERYFVGYDKRTRLCVGICDVEGFKPPGAVPVPFHSPLRSGSNYSSFKSLYWAGPQLYGIDFSNRDFSKLMHAGGDKIHGAEYMEFAPEEEKPRPVAVAVGSEIRVFGPSGEELFRRSMPEGVLDGATAAGGMNPRLQRYYFSYTPSPWRRMMGGKNYEGPHILEAVSSEGKAVDRLTHEADPFPSEVGRNWQGWMSVFSSAPLPAFVQGTGLRLLEKDQLVFYSQGRFVGPTWDIKGYEWAVLLAGSALFSAWAYARSLSWGLSRPQAIRWAGVVGALGAPGFALFWAAANRPVRVECPECQNPRPIEAEDCPSCQKAWPETGRTGVEIFDPADS